MQPSLAAAALAVGLFSFLAYGMPDSRPSAGLFLSATAVQPEEHHESHPEEHHESHPEEHHESPHDGPLPLDVREETEVHVSAEHDEEHEEHAPSPQAFGYSVMLLGAVGFILSLFYLVHHSDKYVVATTWKTLNMTVSIFSSVLVFGMIRAFLFDGFALIGVPLTYLLNAITCLCLFAVLYGLLLFFLFKLRGVSETRVKESHALCAMFGHVTGFAAMFGFVGLMEIWEGPNGKHMTIVIAALAILVHTALTFLGIALRHAIASQIAHQWGEAEEEWNEVVEEAEDDISALSISFALSAVARAHIRGHLQPFEPAEPPEEFDRGDGFVTKDHQVVALFVCGVVFTILGISIGYAKRFTKDRIGPVAMRLMKVWVNIFVMAGAWCILFWADWLMYYRIGFSGERIAACLIIAICATICAVCEMFVMEYMVEHLKHNENETNKAIGKALRNLMLALSLFVGFAWEKSFDVALEDVSHAGGLMGMEPGLVTQFLGLVLLAVVLPAWYWHILPKCEE